MACGRSRKAQVVAMNAISIAALPLLACFCWFLYAALTAPDGYEDEAGFHIGNPKE